MTDSPESLRKRYDALTRDLPVKGEIFLPTEKVPLDQAVAGLERVRALYARRLDTVHRPRMKELRQHWWGADRCFVIGNGPSLNETDLSRLAGEATFAVNGFFLKAGDLDWQPTFYVVEDHLVAEDRAAEINSVGNSIKLFPANLAYCLSEDDDTIFFDHRPRISYPDGFDFSMDADRVTYAGCTVTFTCLQLAAFLGFRRIYLIGVDADYAIPADASRSADYGVQILDMKSDDPNHFDPDYFGKGYRWHDPQVDKMLEAYREARRVTNQHGISILNAGIGGKLEEFPRVSYASLFVNGGRPELGADSQSSTGEREPAHERSLSARRQPRVVIFDLTLLGDGTATGELKASLLGHWAPSRVLHVYGAGSDVIGVRGTIAARDASAIGISMDRTIALLTEFDPECIVYRPVPENAFLHSVAMTFIRRHPAPLVTWIMDDWPERLREAQDERYGPLHTDFCWLLERSSERLVISEQMREAFEESYGYEFEVVANGVDPNDWKVPPQSDRDYLVVRYAGALAENMVFDSVLRVARAVEALARRGVPVRFEVNTRPMWADRFREASSSLDRCTTTTRDLSRAEYREFLQGADVLLIAYNFDDVSKGYIRHSLANKLPECLISGRALLVHGPAEAATVATVLRLLPEIVVDMPVQDQVEAWLEEYLTCKSKRVELGVLGRQVAEQVFRLEDRRATLHECILRATEADAPVILRYHDRSDAAHIDEAALVACLFDDMPPGDRVMVDVGAHHGSSLRPFALKGWTVYAFEPDSDNRSALEANAHSWGQVIVDPRAVSDRPNERLPFYASEVSHGISGLLSFHESHRQVGEVAVTSMAEAVREYGINHIDFLKIDVEGFDFSVLKGVPWDRIAPAVVLCEFEDAKTLQLGHTWRDIANYLMDRGYAVYVSEWYPIERYGVRHQWRSLRRYPCELWAEDGWGNLLAFRSEPRIEQLSFAVNQASPLPSEETQSKERLWAWRSEMRRMYVRFAEYIKHRSNLLFQLGRFGVWTVRTLVGRPGRTVALVLVPLVIVISVLLMTTSNVWRAGGGVVFVIGVGSFMWSVVRDFRKFKLGRGKG